MSYNADASAVYAMYTDPDYIRLKNENTGGSNVEVEVTPNGEGVQIVVSRDLPAEVPSFAKKFTGETIHTTETDVWNGINADGTRDGVIDVDFGKQPMAVNGTLHLASAGAGSVLTVDVDVKANVPFIGRKLEGVTAEQFLRAVEAEEAIGQTWLAK